jgi:hypothetical protein
LHDKTLAQPGQVRSTGVEFWKRHAGRVITEVAGVYCLDFR